MYPIGFYFDPLYLVFALPALLLAFYAQWKVSSAYGKYSRIANMRNITGLDAARYLLRDIGLEGINVEGTPGRLTDHYDPRNKTLYLSAEAAKTPSIAALGIVAHEIGHAQQDAQRYSMMALRSGLVPVVNIGSYLGYFLFLIGIVINATGLAWLGIVFFSGSLIFALVTLPVELNASQRALAMLRSTGLVGTADLDGAKAVLDAAALTYIAAVAQALANLLYFVFVLLSLGGRRRD
jgi:Zn-dependent membrane protease YugP